MRSLSLLSRRGGLFIAGAAVIAGTAGACSGSDDGGVTAVGCPDDLAYFEANIWEPILSKKCAVCHSSDGLAKGSKMVLRPSSEPGALEANFETVKAVAGTIEDGESILLLKPSGRHAKGHTGGELVPFQAPEFKTIETFVSRVTQGKNCDAPVATCTEVTPGARMLRRLSRHEYDATIKDLFGFDSKWGASFTADTVVNGFDNNASALKVTPLLADQARRASEDIAELAMMSPGALVPCDPATGDAACASKFIDSFGKRAFRRPLDDADRKRYEALYAAVAPEAGFAEALETVISAFLQSPYFLYRLELGGLPDADGMVSLTQHEIASELSYFFWGSMPDQELFAAADAGMLASPEGIEKQARRLLADPRSDVMLERFTEQWLEIDRLASVPKDTAVFPELDASLRGAMSEETKRFISHVVREGTGTLPELLTAKYTFASPELAAFYGLPPGAPGEPSMIDLAGTPRGGILTQGSLLTTHARPNASSPIHRGKVIRERLLCQSLPPPPPGLNVQPPPVDPSKSTRDRYIAHATVEPCQSCHRLIDPIGFGFEHFDGIGRYREAEGAHAIDATGEIVATDNTNGAFDGTGELAEALASSPDVHACFALQWFRFAYGVEENASLSCAVDEVAGELTASGLKIEDLLVALTRSAHFTRRMSDGSESGATGGTGSGSGGSGGAGGAGGSPDPGTPGPAPTGDLEVVRTNDTKWETGYCDSVKVTNKGSGALVWSIKLAIDGSITDIWNAKAEGSMGTITVTGLEWNASLEPQASASFGFCASL
jgi:uncharacterized membrane protein YgcG